jgi:hypothetical protein
MALAAGTTAGEGVLREIFGALGDDELALLGKLLDAIDTAMSAAAGPASDVRADQGRGGDRGR